MTTLRTSSVDCAGCLSTQEITLVVSTNAFGSMDLDMRPPPMQRDTLQYQIHRCPSCGFAGHKLAWFEGLDVRLITDHHYLALLADGTYPDVANSFRAYGFLKSKANQEAASVGAYLKAAWVCDDLAMTAEPSVACRQQALSSLSLLNDSGDSYTSDLITDKVLRIDLLRRTKQFNAAFDQVNAIKKGKLPEVLLQILSFQARLCTVNDADCHQVSEALLDIDSGSKAH